MHDKTHPVGLKKYISDDCLWLEILVQFSVFIELKNLSQDLYPTHLILIWWYQYSYMIGPEMLSTAMNLEIMRNQVKL